MLFSVCICVETFCYCCQASRQPRSGKARRGLLIFKAEAAGFSSEAFRDATPRTWTNSSASHYHSH